MELEVSTEVDGVTLRGHVVANGGTLSVRMFEPSYGNICQGPIAKRFDRPLSVRVSSSFSS